MDFKGKNVLVVGAARSGLSAAKLLKSLGASVTLADNKPREKLACEADEMERLGIKLFLGQNAGLDLVNEHSLVVSSPGIPQEMETFEYARRLNVQIIGEMELAFMLCPCPVAAITGTNGKTTTTTLAGEIISSHIEDTKIVGNIGRPFTECVLELSESSFTIIEASSFQLESVSMFKPRISAILNVTPDHLERHKTLQKYIEAKTNVFKYTDENDYVILNKDDPVCSSFKVETGAKVMQFSIKGDVEEGAYLKNGSIMLKYDGAEINLINKNELKILGSHNVENALAAALTAFLAGVPPEIITEGLREFKGVPHRIELVRELDGIKFYNDSKGTNPDASIKALEAMTGETVLIAGGYDKNADFSELAAMFEEKLSYLIVLGKTKPQIINACEKVGFKRYIPVGGYEEAVPLAREKAKESKSGNVLFSPACASWDMFRDFEERGDYIKKLVNKL